MIVVATAYSVIVIVIAAAVVFSLVNDSHLQAFHKTFKIRNVEALCNNFF